VDTPRLRHISWLGWATLPHAFDAAGEDFEDVRVERVEGTPSPSRIVDVLSRPTTPTREEHP